MLGEPRIGDGMPDSNPARSAAWRTLTSEQKQQRIAELEAERNRLLVERNQLVIAIEDHRTEMDARANGPGRDRDDIDNDLYRVLP